jgi:hypothetical protein
MSEKEIDEEEDTDEEVKEIMENHDIDKDTAKHVKEIMEEFDVDEEEAVDLEADL